MISDTNFVFPGKPSAGPAAPKSYEDLADTCAFTYLVLGLAPSGNLDKTTLITFFEYIAR